MESRVIAKESTPLVTLLMASFDYIGDVPQKTFHFQSVLLRFVVAIVYFAIPTRF